MSAVFGPQAEGAGADEAGSVLTRTERKPSRGEVEWGGVVGMGRQEEGELVRRRPSSHRTQATLNQAEGEKGSLELLRGQEKTGGCGCVVRRIVVVSG